MKYSFLKKRLISVLVTGAITLSFTFAQTKKTSVNSRLKDGYVRFCYELNQNLKYPVASEIYNSIGMSVTKISLTPAGKLETFEIINSIDRDIDDAVIEALKKTSLIWLTSDSVKSNRTYYIQIAFILSDGPDDFFFKSAYPDKKMFVRPVAIYGFPEKSGRILGPKDDKYLTNECTNQFNHGNYNRALKLANEMIRRYPYTKQLYQLRILIARKLNNREIVEKDTKKITDFAENMSLDMLMQEN